MHSKVRNESKQRNESKYGSDNIQYNPLDTIIHSGDVAQHLLSLKKVLIRIIEYGLKLNPAKCKFGKDKIQYLGFRVSNGKIYPGEKSFEQNSEFPRADVSETTSRIFRYVSVLSSFYTSFC